MIYVPDQQDEVVSDAEVVGGRAFVEYLQYAASEQADRLVPWDRTGSEPAARIVAWLYVARHLVNEKRATLTFPT